MGKKEKEEGTCSRRRVCLERRKKEQDGERNLKKRGGRAGNRVDGGSMVETSHEEVMYTLEECSIVHHNVAWHS